MLCKRCVNVVLMFCECFVNVVLMFCECWGYDILGNKVHFINLCCKGNILDYVFMGIIALLETV